MKPSPTPWRTGQDDIGNVVIYDVARNPIALVLKPSALRIPRAEGLAIRDANARLLLSAPLLLAELRTIERALHHLESNPLTPPAVTDVQASLRKFLSSHEIPR